MQAIAARHGPRVNQQNIRLCAQRIWPILALRGIHSELMGSDRRLRHRSKRLKADAIPKLVDHTARDSDNDSSEGKGKSERSKRTAQYCSLMQT